MPLTLTFPQGDKINTSVAVGDTLYFVATQASGNFSTATLSNVQEAGVITSISRINATATTGHTIIINPITPTLTIPNGSFILFSKDNTVNSTSVMGYYAKTKFINWSSKKFELFSVGSEVSLSSK